MTKKPTAKKPKPPTLKDLATQLKANLRRMDEMSMHLTTLYQRTADLLERTDCQSRDIGGLVRWKNTTHGKGDAPNIEAVMKRVATMDNRIGTVESGMASIWKRADGVDQALAANAVSHRSEVSRLSNAVLSLEGGQLQHAHMISALEKAATAPDDPKVRRQTDRPDTEAEKAAITRVIQALEILRSVL